MHIVRRDADTLVIHQGPWGLRGLGLLLLTLGSGIAWFITHGHLGEHNAWVAVVVGAMFAVAGLSMLVFATDTVCTFDKGTRSTSIRSRGVRGTTTSIYAWKDVQDAVLEKDTPVSMSNGRPQQPTYRPALVMKDGTRVPWLGYYTSAFSAQANCVAAARDFAGWHQLPDGEREQDAAVTGRAVAQTRLVRRVGLVVLAAVAIVGAVLCEKQVVRYYTWQPIRARITMSEVGSTRDDKGNLSYRPVIQWAYRRGGGEQLAFGTTIFTTYRSESWADGLRRRYVVGDSATAYLDPDDPAHGYLVRELSWVPPVFLALPIMLFGLLMRAGTVQSKLRLTGALHVPIIAT